MPSSRPVRCEYQLWCSVCIDDEVVRVRGTDSLSAEPVAGSYYVRSRAGYSPLVRAEATGMTRLTTLALTTLLAGSMATGGAVAAKAQASSPQSLFEAGKFQEAAQAANGDGSEPGRWLRAHALVRANQAGQAREVLGSLASGDENSPWRLVAESMMAQIDGNLDAAQSLAERAAGAAPDMFEAQYQLGLVKSARGDFGGAADALQRATDINGGFAYAHYYAGLAYSKSNRIDRAAGQFNAFVRQAPEAPEVPAVQAILRTLKGR